MSSRRRVPAFLLLTLALLGIAAAGCSRLATPSGWASPTLAGGFLLVAHKDKLYAYDPATLDAKWRFPPEGGKSNPKPIALYGAPGATGSAIFIPAYDGKLYSVTPSAPDKWQKVFTTDGSLVGGVATAGSMLYFGSSDGKVYAIDSSTGEQTWAYSTDKEVWSTPVVVGDAVYVTSLDGHLYVLDAARGTLRWSFTTDAGIASPPVIDASSGLVYIAGFDSRIRAVDLQSHDERWAVKADNWFWTRPLLADGSLYAGSLDEKIYAVDASSGAKKWTVKTKAPIRAAPIMAGGKVIVVDRKGNVYGLSPSDGSMASEGPVSLGADVLADPISISAGQVLFVSTGGKLITFDPVRMTKIDERPVS